MTRRVLHCTNGSPFGRQVRIVLAEKQLDYDQDQTLAIKRPAATFGALNPGLRVPVLEDDGRTLFDTRIVLEYLLTAYPETPAGAPEPPLADALIRPKHHFDDALIFSALTGLLDTAVNIRQFRLNGITAEQAPYLVRQNERLDATLDWLEDRADEEGFQPGVLAMADLALITAADFGAGHSLFEIGARPRLNAILTRHAERPSVAATRPE